MLMRIHQSGNLAEILNDRLELVREGIECYKRIRGDIPKALPFWPLGIPDFDDEWISFGLETQGKAYLSLYRMQSSKDAFELPLPKFKGKNINIKCIYPKEENCTYNWNPTSGLLSVKFPSNYSARLFEINMR
jgi:alpha-galactosidase